MSHELVAPKLNESFDNVIVVDGLPVVTADKKEKLILVVSKAFKDYQIVDFNMPMNGDTSQGFAFIELGSPQEAQAAKKELHGYAMTKVNTFSITLLADFDRVMSTTEEFKEPQLPAHDEEEENLYSWMLSQDLQDQYVIRVAKSTELYWNSKKDRSLIFRRPDFSDNVVAWSPNGTYIVTFHRPGIAIWGGSGFKRLQRLNHPGVQRIDFSPCERYIVTWANENDPKKPSAHLWDVKTGEIKRSFIVPRPSFPIFRWSHDGKYFARLADDNEEAINVYETPSMALVDKKNIKIPRIRDFEWSPSDNVIAYWVAEEDHIPARISLISIPDRRDVASRNVVTVKDCKLHWQASGDYLAVKVDRYEKKTSPFKNGMWECKACKDKKAPKFAFPETQTRCSNCQAPAPEVKYKNEYIQFEFFHMRQRPVACESFPLKDSGISIVQCFAWEPCGNKFALIHGEAPRTDGNIYQLQQGKLPSLVKTLDSIPCNAIYWNPRGQYCVFAGRYSKAQPLQGTMKFVDTVDGTVETVGHFNATDFEWDPSGRYFTSMVSASAVTLDHGYEMWSLYGNQLQKQNIPNFVTLSWRPRMKTLLKPEHHEKIKANWREYQSRFEVEDKLFRKKASIEDLERRRACKKSWDEKVLAAKARVGSVADRLKALRPALLQKRREETEEIIETFVKEETEIL